MGMKDVMRYWTKKTNQLIRQKKYIDKAKAYWDKLDERHNRARDYSGRGIKISRIWGVDRELVRVRNKWVLREEAPNTYPPKEKEIIDPNECQCPHCKLKRLPS